MRRRLVVLSITVALGFLAAPALAYLDPGTGSYVFQMVVAALVSVGFVVRTYWHRLRRVFTKRDQPPPARRDDS